MTPPRRLARRLPPPLQRREFALFWVSLLSLRLAQQMIAVAVGWQVYDLERNPLHLGLIGLAEFLPLPLLALPAGQLADRLPRRLVFASSVALAAVVAALLLVVNLLDVRELWPYFALGALSGVGVAIGSPAASALPPELVPGDLLAPAIALKSVAGQTAVVGGPALGGLLFVGGPELPYAVATVLLVLSFVGALSLHSRGAVARLPVQEPPGLDSLLAGIRYLRRSRIVLGAITLDLFAVLFGGAVALLPVFARDILHVGPIGLGILRTAPAVGALAGALWLTRRPLGRHAGRTLLVVVGIFGASTIVFGLSRSMWLSCAALAIAGLADMFSMNIRATTVTLATPDELRGRVMAVEMVFISASNELGAFESGVAAAVVGTVTAVVAGGAITVGLALSWTKLFPDLARVDRMEDIRPAAAAS